MAGIIRCMALNEEDAPIVSVGDEMLRHICQPLVMEIQQLKVGIVVNDP